LAATGVAIAADDRGRPHPVLWRDAVARLPPPPGRPAGVRDHRHTGTRSPAGNRRTEPGDEDGPRAADYVLDRSTGRRDRQRREAAVGRLAGPAGAPVRGSA